MSLVAIVSLAMSPAAGWAQQATRQDSVAQRLEPTRITAPRGGTTAGGAAMLVINVDSARIKPSPTLADLMRTVPLVLVRTNSRGEAELSVRGSESRQVGIMLDGLPLSPGWDGRADPGLIPLTGISRVNYVRSTGTVLNGPNALGGVLNLTYDEPAAGSFSKLFSLGTDETGARLFSGTVAGTAGDASSRVTWRLGAGLRDYDGLIRAGGVSDPSGGEPRLRTNTDSREYDYLGRLGWAGANGAGITATVSGFDGEGGVAPELHVAGPRYWRYPERSRRMVQLGATAPRLTSGLGITQIRVSGGVIDGRTRIESFSNATYSTVSGTESGDEKVTNVRAAVSQTVGGGVRFEAAFTKNEISYDEGLNKDPISHYKQALQSAGVEGHFAAGENTLVSAGVVVDRGETVEAGGKTPLGPKDLTGWRLGVTHAATPSVRLFAAVGERGRFAALRELYSGALNKFEPNPNLKPERLLTTEAGFGYGDPDAVQGFNAQITGFYHYLEDGIVRVAFGNTKRFQRVNRDETRTTGLEALLGWRGGEGKPSLTLDLVAQRARIAATKPGADDAKPEHMPGFRGMLDGEFPLGNGFTFGANVQHMGSQYCVNPDTGKDQLLGSQSLGGVTLRRGWAVGSGLFRWVRAVVGLDNLTNAAYYEQCGLPRAGRTLRVGVELR